MRAGPIALLFAMFAAMAGPADGGEPAFVGSAACAVCHEAETEAWRGSHHDLAMREATDRIVLGDFNNAAFTHGITSRFFRRDGKFVVNTDGPDDRRL